MSAGEAWSGRLSRRGFLVGAAALAAAGCSSSTAPTPKAAGGPTGPPEGAGTVAVGPVTAADAAAEAPAVAGPAAEAIDAPADPGFGADPFALGVASGDPTEGAVVLWTRLLAAAGAAEIAGDVPVACDVALDAGFSRLVGSSLVAAPSAEAHTVHHDATGLAPDTWYWYRFRLGPWTSPAGRTRTAPAPGAVPTAAMRLVAASCQRYPDGLYGAYRHVVADAPDVVVWCGDYVYERAADGVRSQPAGEASDLASYRALYAHYRGDAELQRAHAACPWIVTWDDHEVADNYAGALANGVDGTSEEASASFLERRAAAYRAWWEHMPVRIPAPDGPDLAIHRRLDWGGLVTLAVLDGRQYRSDQPCGVAVGDLCDAADDPAATMLGADQEGWLAGVLDDSARRAAPWTVLVNQTVLTSARVRAGGRTLAAFDQWDGYGAARDRLLAAAVAVGVPERTNLVVLTGDIHASLVGEVERDGSPVGVEFVSPSISSALSAERASQLALTPLLVRAVRVADGDHRGYVLHEIDPSRWRASYRWLDDATVEQPPLVAGAPRFEVRRGEAGVRQI